MLFKLQQIFVYGMVAFIPNIVYGQEQEQTQVLEKAQEMLDPAKLQDVAVQQWDTAKSLVNMIIEFLVNYSFQVLGGVIVLVLGWLVARYVGNFVMKFFDKKQLDVTVSKFVVGTIKLSIIVFAIIVALGKFGIEIAPLIAGISVVGFGVSFALQGPLSNYAAGISLIFTKPFKVGQIIEVAGVIGEVTDIKIPRTEMKTVDGTTIMIPNKHVIGEIIHNYSNDKRLDINIGVAYDSDVQKAISIIEEVVKKDKRTNSKKVPKIGISEFADSSINIYARIWCKQDAYWDVMFDINRKVLEEFGKNKIEIPFPQRDVHIIDKT